jgi:hypothetical protein
MASQGCPFEVIHSGAFQRGVGQWKSCRFDEVQFDIQTGGEAEQRACVLGNVRLKEG